MRRQPSCPGITLVLALIGAGMSEGQNIPWDLSLSLVSKSSGMDTVRTVRKFSVSLLASLGDQLQVTLRVGLQDPPVVRSQRPRVVGQPIDRFIAVVEVRSLD